MPEDRTLQAPPLSAPRLRDAKLGSAAGFWQRVGGLLIDGAILLIPLFLLDRAMRALELRTWVIWLVPQVLGTLYAALFQSSALRATPGKLMFGLEVTDLEGQRIGFSRSLLRALGYYPSSLLFGAGYFLALVTPRHRALHDLIAGTLVVRAREPVNLDRRVTAVIASLLVAFYVCPRFPSAAPWANEIDCDIAIPANSPAAPSDIRLPESMIVVRVGRTDSAPQRFGELGPGTELLGVSPESPPELAAEISGNGAPGDSLIGHEVVSETADGRPITYTFTPCDRGTMMTAVVAS